MKIAVVMFSLLIVGLAQADEIPVGSSKTSLRPEQIVLQEEIQKDINSSIGPVISEQEETWREVAIVNQVLESVPSLRQSFF